MRLSTWLVLRCKEPAFQRFLGANDEDEAAAVVRILCQVDSRGDIDRNPEAEQRFHNLIRKPYLTHQQENTCSSN